MSSNCPLCLNQHSEHLFFQKHHNRDFFQCQNCQLIYVSREHVLDLKKQKDHYDQHQNLELTIGYKNFLTRLITPLKEKGLELKRGLDFGSGPYPMLRDLLLKEGFKSISIYDPIYAYDENVLGQKFDYIVCCEVIEHFVDFRAQFELLLSLLETEGLLILSTGLKPADTALKDWSYIQDITHISILSQPVLEYLKEQYDLEYEILGKDLISLWKKQKVVEAQ